MLSNTFELKSYLGIPLPLNRLFSLQIKEKINELSENQIKGKMEPLVLTKISNFILVI